jgi:hypothetical protein
MPSPSLPTGTVSRASLGSRTFPPDDVDRPDVGDPTSGRASDRPVDATTRTGPSSPTPGPAPATDGGPSVSKAETVPGAAPHDAAPPGRDASRRPPSDVETGDLRERVAELERENAALRRDLRRKQREQQDVIDRYERVIDDVRDDERGSSDETSVLAALSTAAESADGRLRDLADRLGDRLDRLDRQR